MTFKTFFGKTYENDNDEAMSRKYGYNYDCLKKMYPDVYKLSEKDIKPMINKLYEGPANESFEDMTQRVQAYAKEKEHSWNNKKQVDYAKYGDDTSQNLINEMLTDQRFQNTMNKRTIKNEGGYNNDPTDNGGETKYGISKKIYKNENIRNLTRERANAILYRDYWKYNGINTLPDNLIDIVFDNAVVQGQPTAIQNLHKALNIPVGNIIGKETISKLKNSNIEDVKQKFIQNVQANEDSIIKKNPELKKYQKGWRVRSNNYHQ